jgi:hypothetical protein
LELKQDALDRAKCGMHQGTGAGLLAGFQHGVALLIDVVADQICLDREPAR